MNESTQSRADQIFARFKTFHRENPQIWELFKRFAFVSVERGRERYSVDAIIERIRWHVDIETRGDAVKINNDFRAYYARMFMAKFPEHDGFFEIRRRVSAEREAYDVDLTVFNTGRPVDEADLRRQLRDL